MADRRPEGGEEAPGGADRTPPASKPDTSAKGGKGTIAAAAPSWNPLASVPPMTSWVPSMPTFAGLGKKPGPVSSKESRGSGAGKDATAPSATNSLLPYSLWPGKKSTKKFQFATPIAKHPRQFVHSLDEHMWMKHCPHCHYIVRIKQVGSRRPQLTKAKKSELISGLGAAAKEMPADGATKGTPTSTSGKATPTAEADVERTATEVSANDADGEDPIGISSGDQPAGAVGLASPDEPVDDADDLAELEGVNDVLSIFQCGREACRGLGLLCRTCEDGLAYAAEVAFVPTAEYIPISPSKKPRLKDSNRCLLCKDKDHKLQDFRAERCLRAVKELVAPLLSCITIHNDVVQLTDDHRRRYDCLLPKLASSCPSICFIARVVLEWLVLLPAAALKADWLRNIARPGCSTTVRSLTQVFIRYPDDTFSFLIAMRTVLKELRDIVTNGLQSEACKVEWAALPPHAAAETGLSACNVSLQEAWLIELDDVVTYLGILEASLAKLSAQAVQCAPVVLADDGRRLGSKLSQPGAAGLVFDAANFVMDAGDYVDVAMGAKDVATAVVSGPPSLLASASTTVSGFTASSSVFHTSFNVASTTMKVTDNITMGAVLYAADGITWATGSVAAGSALGMVGLVYVGIAPTVTAIKGLDWMLPEDTAGSLARVAGITGGSVGALGTGTVLAAASMGSGEATVLAATVHGMGALGTAAGGTTASGMAMVAAVPAGLALLTAGGVYAGVKLGQHIAQTYSLSVATFRRIRDDEMSGHIMQEANRLLEHIRDTRPLREPPLVASVISAKLDKLYAGGMEDNPEDELSADILKATAQMPMVKLCSHCNKASVFTEKSAATKLQRAEYVCHRCEGDVTPCRLCDVGYAKSTLEWCSLCWAPSDETVARDAALLTQEASRLWAIIPEKVAAFAKAKREKQGWAVFDRLGREIARTLPKWGNQSKQKGVAKRPPLDPT